MIGPGTRVLNLFKDQLMAVEHVGNIWNSGNLYETFHCCYRCIYCISPPTASAETWWLVLSARNGGVGAGAITIDLETVAMKSEQQCEEAGEKIFYSKNLDAPNNVHHARMIQNIRYICVEGK